MSNRFLTFAAFLGFLSVPGYALSIRDVETKLDVKPAMKIGYTQYYHCTYTGQLPSADFPILQSAYRSSGDDPQTWSRCDKGVFIQGPKDGQYTIRYAGSDTQETCAPHRTLRLVLLQ